MTPAEIEAVALALLADIGNRAQFDLVEPYRRIITVQLSSEDFRGMARAAITALSKLRGA